MTTAAPTTAAPATAAPAAAAAQRSRVHRPADPAGAAGVVDATDPVALTRELVAVPSVSGGEQRLADLVERRLRQRAPGLEVHRIGNNVVARTRLGTAERVLLAGHLDTVPPGTAGDRLPQGPDEVHGLGAVDMKGGLALMLLLAEQAAAGRYDCSFVFYDQEEIGSRRSGMNILFAEHRQLLEGDFAIVLEPTGGLLEAGCQGNLVVELDFAGVRAHTARPWRGSNAIQLAVPALARLAAYRPEPVVVDGLAYRQSFSVVGVSGGVQGNVVPDSCTIRVNYRHAPTIAPAEAAAVVAALAPEASAVRTVLDSPPAAPRLGHPLLDRLRAGGGLAVRPKLGWTDVGRFAAHGIPAVNFGPGDPELAHSPREVVDRTSLEDCLRALQLFLAFPTEAENR